MEIIDNKAMKILVKQPDRITQVIPKSKWLREIAEGVHEVLVHFGIDEMQVLKNLNLTGVRSPIAFKYNWPGLHKPFLHQLDTAEFLTLHRRCYCLNEQGTGKTSSALWAADYLMSIGKVKRCLIVCPVSIMKAAWVSDGFKTVMHRQFAVAHGTQAQRKVAINSSAEFVVINYDGVTAMHEELVGKFDLIIGDECFVEGTKVSTPNGQVVIEKLKVGDKVYTSSGVRAISRFESRSSNDIVTLEISNGKRITCTGNHPFFTDQGWVTARNLSGRRLISETEVPNLRKGVSVPKEEMVLVNRERLSLRGDLLSILQGEEDGTVEPKSAQSIAHTCCESTVIENILECESQTQRSNEEKDIGQTESNRALSESSRWERDRDDHPRETYSRSDAERVYLELHGLVGEDARRLSFALQTRLCDTREKDMPGSGRRDAHRGREEKARCEEDSDVGKSWVVSVSNNECKNPRIVYNLEVEGTPNYYVESFLVHNCTAWKNPSTNRWKAASKIVKPDTWVWLMTGTPAAQSPLDAYGLAKLCTPSHVPAYAGAWRDKTMVKLSMFKWVPAPRAIDLVNQALQPAIRYTKAECLDLPEMMYQTRDVPMSKQQAKYYKLLKTKLTMAAAGEQITAVHAASALNKLLQISSGCVYSDTGEVVKFEANERLAEMISVIQESSHKTVVFVPFKHAIKIVVDHIEKEGYTVASIYGDVSLNKRTEIFKNFQETPDPQVLVVQPQSAAHGITLTAASTIIWFGPTASVETYLQGNARIHRAGQTQKTLVVRLRSSEAEKKVYAALDGGANNQEALMKLYEDILEGE